MSVCVFVCVCVWCGVFVCVCVCVCIMFACVHNVCVNLRCSGWDVTQQHRTTQVVELARLQLFERRRSLSPSIRSLVWSVVLGSTAADEATFTRWKHQQLINPQPPQTSDKNR